MDSYTVAPVEPSPVETSRAPWGLADMAKAIAIVIALTVLISLPGAVIADVIVSVWRPRTTADGQL